jgi:hypothetical protein
MTQEIIEMARDSGMELYGLGKDRARFVHHLEAFAKLVAEAEREACAKVCDSFYESWINIHGRYEFMGEGAQECAEAIRARGQA